MIKNNREKAGFWGIKLSTSILVQTLKICFFAKYYFKFLAFSTFLKLFWLKITPTLVEIYNNGFITHYISNWFFNFQEIGESYPMVVNLLRDTKRCRLTSDSRLGDYFAELSDDVRFLRILLKLRSEYSGYLNTLLFEVQILNCSVFKWWV